MKWMAKDLLGFLEEYYGEKYTGTTLDVMTDYLDGHSDAFYRATVQVMTRRFSRSYGKSPCPADIERHMDEIKAAMPKPKALPEARPEMTDADMARGREWVAELKGIVAGRFKSPWPKLSKNI